MTILDDQGALRSPCQSYVNSQDRIRHSGSAGLSSACHSLLTSPRDIHGVIAEVPH